MPEIIIVKDKKTGKITLDFSGFSGDKCLEEAKRLVDKAREGGLNIEITGLTQKPSTETQEKQREKVRE